MYAPVISLLKKEEKKKTEEGEEKIRKWTLKNTTKGKKSFHLFNGRTKSA